MAGVMVAVKVTIWLTAEGDGEPTTVVVVAVLPTTWTSADEALPVKFVSPLV